MQQFFESQFGSTPQIDLDRQLARVRIVRPQPLDVRRIAQDGVIKNNMGLGGIELRVRGTLQDGTVTFVETGQTLPVTGGPARSQEPWLRFDAGAFGRGEAEAIAWLGEAPGPGSGER